ILGKGRLPALFALVQARPGLSLLSGAINGFSYLFLLVALQHIEVSVAEPASMLGMVVTVLLSGWIFKEKILDRLVGVLVMIAGTWLLFLAP
ncbi:MAG: EamA family transporter, partial [Desulfovibrionales bacterium]